MLGGYSGEDPGHCVGEAAELEHAQGAELLLQEARHHADNRGQDVVQGN